MEKKIIKRCDVLFVVNEFPPGPGGVGTHAYEIIHGLKHLGVDIKVLCNQDYSSPEEIEAFNAKQDFEIFNNDRNQKGYVLQKLWDLIKLIKQIRPKVIMTSGAWASLYAWIPEKLFKIQKFVFIHGSEYSMSFPDFVTKLILNDARLIAVSHFTKRCFLKCGLDADVMVINNGANPGQFLNAPDPFILNELKEKHGLSGKNIILTIGRLCDRKGQDTVIKAMEIVAKEFPNALYIMVGHEEEKEKLERLIRNLNLKANVKIIGQVPASLLVSFYVLSDIYVLNSRLAQNGDVEGFGISIIEAAFAGKPAIGTLDCGIEDAIVDGKTGFLVQNNSHKATAQAILLMLRDPQERNKMGLAAKQRALDNFTWTRAVRQTHDAIKEYL